MPKVFTITEGLENLGALHSGGQGSVYKARRTGEWVTAVKILPTPIFNEDPSDKNFVSFQNEVAKLKKVNEHPSPNVVRIISSGITETGAFPFIEMEFIDGPDLEALLKPPHEAVFTVAEVVKVAGHLANALAHCHAAGVKHADVKSNNVKYNQLTGHYVLLDFGLSIMSDEQRRTSLRHAGAVEFMAPEQHHGQLLFESDVYSFGVVLYELLAGRVPFQLGNKTESARNSVMLAHLEQSPPNLMPIRQQNLPAAWAGEKAAQEMQVPDWLLQLIERCLQKQPAQRFANGMALKVFIEQQKQKPTAFTDAALLRLKQEHKQVLAERDALRQALQQKAKGAVSKKNGLLLPALFLLGGLLMGYAAVSLLGAKPNRGPEIENASGAVKPRNSIGQYMVVASRAWFHNEPDEGTRRKAFMIPSNDVVSALEERNGFVYIEFTNSKGQQSKGWLRKSDLMPLAEWNKRNAAQSPVRLRQEDIDLQLAEAEKLMEKAEVKEAVYIYSYLARQQVPQAMYLYGTLALQKKHNEIDCKEGFDWLSRAANKGYPAARRTLGFLYIFADNPKLLEMNNYNGCSYERNVFKGAKLLAQALAAGDSTAGKLLKQINLPLADSLP